MDGGRLQERRHPQTAGSLAPDCSTESGWRFLGSATPADRVNERVTAPAVASAGRFAPEQPKELT
jgi:hypothetical protein